jgi:4-hydroxythreonine-4-phosphate dehydrogenase
MSAGPQRSDTVLALTAGEPAGIGPDITIMAWQRLYRDGPAFVLIGDADIIRERASRLGIGCPVQTIDRVSDACDLFSSALPILQTPAPAHVDCGTLDQSSAEHVLYSINRAVELVLEGQAGAVVTNPIHKAALYTAGFAFQGHTDYLADLARNHGHNALPVMMLDCGILRTVPVTVHIPVKEVPGALSTDAILQQVRIVHRDLRLRYGLSTPRIGVTGLNPHAGEDGAMGREEIDIIAPAIRTLISEGMNVTGPLPADTVFHEEARSNFDVIVCMYHDQALIPVKTIGFHDGVNVTLGLPFIRTSPDHGTALALAGTGKANPSSLVAALKLAAHMAGSPEAARG